jgi:ketol-acid reductoisomerase
MKVLSESDVDLSVLDQTQIAVIGYGNQGRAQSRNMRDQGLDVLVGTLRDASWELAQADGFEVHPPAEAARLADVICLLVPDEVQAEVYNQSIAPHLSRGKVLDFAHGYNVHYGFIRPPADVDVVMVAPRMIGIKVRALFEAGSGAPAYVAVWQDASGHALERALALAAGIGATRAATIDLTFAEETELDHFCEQVVWAAITRIFLTSFEFLVEQGYDPEVVALELYASGEAGEIVQEMADIGFFEQMRFHSRTSQYGTLSRGPVVLDDAIKERMRVGLDQIRNGTFAREWELERMTGFPVFNRLWARALAHPLNDAETRLRDNLKR